MRYSPRSKLSILFSLVVIAAVVGGFMITGALRGQTSHARAATTTHMYINCGEPGLMSSLCTEVQDPSVFGEYYIGHDEPSTLFYSNQPGSGNSMRYDLTLPKDPSPTAPLTAGKAYNFQLHVAFWFGMAMCDTQSFPELLNTCTPNSDKNIVDPAISPNHPGTAFMEMQFYPPGWALKPFGVSCDATKWCAALNIDSFEENPVTGQLQNATCQAIAGLEPVNFAYITKSGVPQPLSPPNPVNSTLNTFTPDPNADLFMNSGDNVVVTMHDTQHGLQIVLNDKTTHQSGSMTASAANGFGQTQFDPTGTTCNNIPYDFHPMYSTSSELTRVTWAAHSYNIAFADEIGHFDDCTVVSTTGTCTGNEGITNDQEAADGDDAGCLPASASTLVQVAGCTATNTGFDGVPYQPVWPDGNTKLHPTSILFTSPLTGNGYSRNYSRIAFEANLPRIENPAVCDRFTGVGCTLIPTTDDPATAGPGFMPASFYPFFSIGRSGSSCVWQIGNHIPGSKNDFGQNQQYGTLLNTVYTGVGGGPIVRYNDFRQILSKNPCLA